jgi:hypothetical protein
VVKKIFLAPSVNVSGLTRRALRESVVLPLNNPHATKLAKPGIAKSPLFQPIRGCRRVGPRAPPEDERRPLTKIVSRPLTKNAKTEIMEIGGKKS